MLCIIIIRYFISAVKFKYLVISTLAVWLVASYVLHLICCSSLTASWNWLVYTYAHICSVPVLACFIYIPIAVNVVLLVHDILLVCSYLIAYTVSEKCKFEADVDVSPPWYPTEHHGLYATPEVFQAINECVAVIFQVSIIPTSILIWCTSHLNVSW